VYIFLDPEPTMEISGHNHDPHAESKTLKGTLMNKNNLRIGLFVLSFVFTAAPSPAQNASGLIAKMAALEARVAKLEGQITASDLVGTYAVHGFQNEFGLPSPFSISSYVFQGTLTLEANFTGSFDVAATGNRLLNTGTLMRLPVNVSNQQSITWSYLNGTVSSPEIPMTFSVIAGGQLLVGTTAQHSDGTNVLLILTR
jgi:hypothetical protein